MLQIIRQPVVLLLVLWSYRLEYFGIDSTAAVAFALSAQSQLGRTHLHHNAVHSSNNIHAVCTRKVGGLSMTKSQSCHRLYSGNSRLAAAASNSHDEDDDDADRCTIDEEVNSISSNCNKSERLRIHPQQQQIDRRTALLSMSLLTTTTTTLLLLPSQAASSSEIDTSTGELFSPKNQMIKGGGSIGGRGIPLKKEQLRNNNNNNNNKQSLLTTSGLIQSVYETRFITYLTRFLLVYDPAARAWWKKNRAKANQMSTTITSTDNSNTNNATTTMMMKSDEYFNAGEQFAEFAESVEIGLADYFLGPYGSYASVAAAKAGLDAVAPARSSSSSSLGDGDVKSGGGLFGSLFGGGADKEQSASKSSSSSSLSSKKKKKKKKKKTNANEEIKQNRQGVLNLFTLLSTRYTSIEEKQQLAILFSLISKPELQPVKEIRGLLGEIDNGTIAEIQVEVDNVLDDFDLDQSRDYFRLSSRQGGGFASSDAQVISIEPPAPLGDDYRPAKIQTIMKPTSRILRINVVDGGEGYTVAPDVIVKQSGVSRQCEAAAIIDRKGSVSEVIVLNPGFGYRGSTKASRGQPTLPTVEFRERRFTRQKKKKSSNSSSVSKKVKKPAKAMVELEYQVAGATILDGGSGYSFDSPPDVKISLPPTDPDWFVSPNIYGQSMSMDDDENQYIAARVTKIQSGGNGVILDTEAAMRGGIGQRVTRDILRTVLRDPVALLPSTVRPELSIDSSGVSSYSIKSLPRPPSKDVILPSNYRSIDPLFGGIGRAPVTKNQVTLSADQYSRLALSGAICTVLVRTALNPLELVKTKIQLGNDEEIIQYAREKAEATSESLQSEDKPALGTTQVIQSLVEVRGPLSLFQSADVTFLASVVFGLFGFGATELFRRAFSAVFFDEAAAAANSPNEFVLLAAAGVATVLTCAAASPFELLRVRSMAQIENEGVDKIFKGFVDQNRQKRGMKAIAATSAAATPASSSTVAVATKGLQLDDIKPFWSSFYPIVSRELPFAVTKFLVFDLAAGNIADFLNNSNIMGGDTKIQVGVGTAGLLLSAFSGALAGIAGAFVSHPADLILTLTSASSREGGEEKDWRDIVQELLSSDGGVLNLYAGFPARAVFFFLVIGAQFFLYDYVKTLLQVGTDDLTLVLDVFYAIRQGL